MEVSRIKSRIFQVYLGKRSRKKLDTYKNKKVPKYKKVPKDL